MNDDLIPGPCEICGTTNYRLSMGGPGICPSCDCGDFSIAKVQRQATSIVRLEVALAARDKEIAGLAEHLDRAVALGAFEINRANAAKAEVKRLYDILLRIAFDGDVSSLAGNPAMWPATIAYIGLGGRFKAGERLDERTALPRYMDDG